MRMPRCSRISLLTLAGALLALVVPLDAHLLADEGELAPAERRGKEIYLRGASPSGETITALMAGRYEMPAATMPCVGCHGRNGRGRPEGGVVPSDLTWSALTKPYGLRHSSGREHPAYDERSLKRAITLGSDPADNELHAVMPRYRFSHQDLDDLVAYLKRLGTELDPGLTAESITLATLLPEEGRFGSMGRAMAAVLDAYFRELSDRGGIYSRRIELRMAAAPEDPRERAAALRRLLESGEIFALVGAFLAGAEEETTEVLRELETPLVGPFTLHPRLDFPLNPFVFYVLPGLADQGRVLVDFAARQPEGQQRPAVVSTRDLELGAVAEAVATRVESLGGSPTLRRSYWAAELNPYDLVADLQGKGVDTLFLLAPADHQGRLLQHAGRAGWTPRVFLPASLAGGGILEAPAAFDGRIFLAAPSLPSDQAPAGLAELSALAAKYGLSSRHGAAQAATLAAAHIIVGGLHRVGRDLSRHRLLEELEGLYDFETGLTAPVTYGPNRRTGVLGAHVLAVDLERRTLVPASDLLTLSR